VSVRSLGGGLHIAAQLDENHHTLCSELPFARRFGLRMESFRRIGVSLGLAVDGQIRNARIGGTYL
jgi:hypothetical protein